MTRCRYCDFYSRARKVIKSRQTAAQENNRPDRLKARGRGSAHLRAWAVHATTERVPLFIFYLPRARACADFCVGAARRGTLADFNAYFLATNGSDSTYPDPVRPRVAPGAPQCTYEYATIKRDLFISMTPEIDRGGKISRAFTVEVQDRPAL